MKRSESIKVSAINRDYKRIINYCTNNNDNWLKNEKQVKNCYLRILKNQYKLFKKNDLHINMTEDEWVSNVFENKFNELLNLD